MGKKSNKQKPRETAVSKEVSQASNFIFRKNILAVIVVLFSVLLYSRSLNHEFVLDDFPVVVNNEVTHQGVAGLGTIFTTDYWYGQDRQEIRGKIYRPTSLALFAVIWEFFPESTTAYHTMNLIVFGLCGLMLFLMLAELFTGYSPLLAFFCTLLFAAHPVHTEVVNNVKSMDEMLCFLFGVSSVYCFLHYLKNKKIIALLPGGLFFALSAASKENGVTFLALIPLFLYFFRPVSKKTMLPVIGSLLLFGALYFAIRIYATAGVPNNGDTLDTVLNNILYRASGWGEKWATIFFILFQFIKLLFIPHPLTSDYNYAQLTVVSFSNATSLFSVLLYVALIVFAALNFRKKNIFAFCILFFIVSISPVSNIFFLNGANMAERFLFLPSLAFCIFLPFLIIKLAGMENKGMNFKKIAVVLTPVFLLFSMKTVSRSQYWKNNLTIFSEDVKTSSQSVPANTIYGRELYDRTLKIESAQDRNDTLMLAKTHLLKAVSIYPQYNLPTRFIGGIYYIEKKYDSAYYYQRKDVESYPNNSDIWSYLGKTLCKLEKYDSAIITLNKSLTLNPKNENACFSMAQAYTNKGDLDKGLLYFMELIKINPNRADAYNYISKIYKAKNDEVKAIEFERKAKEKNYRAEN